QSFSSLQRGFRRIITITIRKRFREALSDSFDLLASWQRLADDHVFSYNPNIAASFTRCVFNQQRVVIQKLLNLSQADWRRLSQLGITTAGPSDALLDVLIFPYQFRQLSRHLGSIFLIEFLAEQFGLRL